MIVEAWKAFLDFVLPGSPSILQKNKWSRRGLPGRAVQSGNPGKTLSYICKWESGRIKIALPFNTNKQIMSEVNSTKRPFLIKMTNIDEVRMGSPFKHCNIELVGFDKVGLPRSGWQDKYAWSDDSTKLVLIKWDFENNLPGFHLLMIDIETGQTKESPKLFGLTKNISLKGDKVKLNKFLYDKEKSKPGHLCCEVDEEYEFT